MKQLPLKGMVSRKSNDFLWNDRLPLVFSSQFSFIVNKLTLEIDNDKLDLFFAKILTKYKN